MSRKVFKINKFFWHFYTIIGCWRNQKSSNSSEVFDSNSKVNYESKVCHNDNTPLQDLERKFFFQIWLDVLKYIMHQILTSYLTLFLSFMYRKSFRCKDLGVRESNLFSSYICLNIFLRDLWVTLNVFDYISVIFIYKYGNYMDQKKHKGEK